MRALPWGLFTVSMLNLFPVPVVEAEEPGREFTATAVVNSSQGRRRMPVTFVVRRFTTVEEAQHLGEVLRKGGQGALLSALRGRSDGELRLGAVQMPIALVVVEPVSRGRRYIFLTPRRISVEEQQFGEESLDYPFGMVEFEVGRLGSGKGSLHVAAALRIDDDGRLEVEDYDGADGYLENLKRVR
jgi:hypothetical protein